MEGSVNDGDWVGVNGLTVGRVVVGECVGDTVGCDVVGDTMGRIVGTVVGDTDGELVGGAVGTNAGVLVMQTRSPLHALTAIAFKISTVRLHDVTTCPPSTRGEQLPQVAGQALAKAP